MTAAVLRRVETWFGHIVSGAWRIRICFVARQYMGSKSTHCSSGFSSALSCLSRLRSLRRWRFCRNRRMVPRGSKRHMRGERGSMRKLRCGAMRGWRWKLSWRGISHRDDRKWHSDALEYVPQQAVSTTLLPPGCVFLLFSAQLSEKLPLADGRSAVHECALCWCGPGCTPCRQADESFQADNNPGRGRNNYAAD